MRIVISVILISLSVISFAQNATYLYQYVDEFEGIDEIQTRSLRLSNNIDTALLNIPLRLRGDERFLALSITDNFRTFKEEDKLTILIKGIDGNTNRIVLYRNFYTEGNTLFFSEPINPTNWRKLSNGEFIGVRLEAHGTYYTFKDNLSDEQKKYFKGIAKELEEVRTGSLILPVEDDPEWIY